MESQAISREKMNSKEFQDLIKPWIVMEKLDDILNSKTEPFERKVLSLIEVWKSVSELDFSKFRIQNIIKIVDWAKLHALDIVLNGQWGKIKDYFCDHLVRYIEKAQAGLASRNGAFSSRCEKLADVVRRPWEHPVLNKLINNKDAQIGPEEIEFFCVETIYLVSVRLKKLCENRCQDLALNLSTNYLKYKKVATLQNVNLNATDTQLWFIFDIHIALLYKFQEKNNINKELKELPLEEGVLLIKRFTRKRVKIAKIWCNFEKIAMYGCRFFLSKAMTCDGDENVKQAQRYLLKTYLTLSNTDPLLDSFILTARNFTKLADAEGLFVMCEVIHREGSGSKMFHFAIEMFIRAITTDMNEMERLKHSNEVDKIKYTTVRLAQSFEYLGDLLDHEVKVARETVLTAFSIYPTQHRLNRIIDLARRSGYEVLDTGQEEWLCRLHPPVIPSDDLQWICPECGEWMCEPVLTDPTRVNIPLQEALQECLLDIPLTVRDDLVVCLSNPRYQILSWGLSWDDLHRLCIFYLNDPEKTKNFVTELKFIKLKLDYSKFDNIKREPVDEYPGIEKGYEQYLDIDFNPEEEQSIVSDNARISPEGSDENGDNSPLSPTTSNPNTLKSLRMYRPNLKRKNIDGNMLIQEKKVTQATQGPSESKVARISPTGFNMTTVGNSSGYKPENLLATSYISQILPSCTQSDPVDQTITPIKHGKKNFTQSFASTSRTAWDTIFDDSENDSKNDSENDSIDEIELQTQQDIINSKNVMAATLPQLGGQVAQKQLCQVPYQQQPHKVPSLQSFTASASNLKAPNCGMSESLYPNGESLAQMKQLKVRIIPLERSQLPKTLATKQNLARVPAPLLMNQGFPQTVLESPVSAPITLNLIPDFQQTPSAPNRIASMESAKDLVVLLQKVPELEASLAAIQPKFLIATAKSTKICNTQPSIPTPKSGTISDTELDTLLPTPKSTATCSPELNTLLPAPKSIATSTTEPDVIATPVMSPTELNTVLPKTETTTMSKTEVDLLTSADTELATMTALDLTTPDLDILTTSLTVDLLQNTTMEKTASTTEFSFLNFSTTKLENLATSSTEVDLLTTPTTALSKTDLNFSSKSKTDLDVLNSFRTACNTPLDLLTMDKAGLKTQPSVPNLSSHQSSTASNMYSIPNSTSSGPKTLETCTTPEPLETCTTPETLETCTTPETLETCTTPEGTLLTEDPYAPQAHPPVQIQLERLPILTSYQESPTAVVCPANSPLLTPTSLISLPGVHLAQIQKAPIMANAMSSPVQFDKDEVSECDKKTDIQSTNNGQDMASDKLGTNNKTVETDSVTIINGADNCSTINNVNTNLSCDNDTNEVPLNDLDEDNIQRHEIVIIVVEELDFPLSETAIFSENVDADIITENISNIDFTSTDVTAAVLKDIPNSPEIVQKCIPEDSLPLDDYSGTQGTASTTSETKINNLQPLPRYSQAEDEKCLNQYKSHQKFPKTDVLVQHLESSFVLRDSCNFHKKPKIENLASAIKDNYVKTNKDFQSNISVFSKAKNDRNVKLQLSLDDASESWIPWKWQKSNLKMYSNNRKRKHDSVPCFKLDDEKDCKPFSVNFQRSIKQISSPKANVIIANPEYCKPPIILNKYVKKTPFYDFTNHNEIRPKKNIYGRKSHQKYKLVQKTLESIQQPPRILNSEMENFIRSVPGLHDYSEISPTNMTHVVNVVEHADPRSSTVTNTNTQTSTQVTPHIQRIGQAKLDRKTDHYDVDPEPSSSTVMSAPSTSQSTLINILSAHRTSQKSTQPRQTPMVNILSQQIYMPSLDPHQGLEVSALPLSW